MITLIEGIISSIIQGLTEFLPVSSSGNVAVLENLFSFQSLSFVVLLEFSSLLAIIALFWRDIVKVFSWKEKENLRYFIMLIAAVVPAGIAGVFLGNVVTAAFSNLFFIGIFFTISGIIILLSKLGSQKRKDLKWWDPIVIGLLQALAIFPGVSRSGTTISAGMYRGLKREEAVRFSFLLAIPTILGATLVEARHISFSAISVPTLTLTFVLTFLISLAGIKILLWVIKKDKFYWFGVYDVAIGIFSIVWGLLH